MHAPKSILRRPLDWFRPYAGNPKRHPEDQIARLTASLQEYGWTIPILATSEGEVIAGHGRLLAAARLELEDAPVIIADHLSEPQRRAYRIADNRLAELATWDNAALRIEVDALAEAGFDVALSGWTDAELDDLLRQAGSAEPPEEFPEYDEDIPTEHECPSCGYRWSGASAAKSEEP